MKNIDDLYKLIEKENIILEEMSFSPTCIEGIYFKVPGVNPTIGINNIIISDSRKYISVLAEELGHHFTSIGNLTAECVTYSQKLNISRQEKRARMWAANYLISDKEIIGAILNNISTLNGLSLHFNVKQWIVKYKLLSIFNNEDKYNSIRKTIMDQEVVYENCYI